MFAILLTGCNTIDPEPTPEDHRTALERFEEEGMTEDVLNQMMEEQTAEIIKAIMTKEIIVDETQTGNLEIWIPPDMREPMLNPAIALYKDMYPNVNVIVLRRFSDSLGIITNYHAYTAQLATELMAGKGPDVLFPSHMPPNADLFKMADNGVFYNLNEFVEQDKDFNLDDYIKGVIDGGVYKGKRYAVPVDYMIPGILLSVPIHMDKIGFDRSQMSDVTSFMKEIMRTLPEAQKQQAFRVVREYSLWWDSLYGASGIQFINYETNTVLPDEEGLLQLLEAYKPYYSLDNKSFQRVTYERMISGEVLFDRADFASQFFGKTSMLKGGVGYQINSLRGVDGKIHAHPTLSTAIRSGSREKQNAWNFIKVLLSPEIQNNWRGMAFLPVHKDSLIAMLETGRFETKSNLTDEEMQEYIDMLMSVDYCNVLSYNFALADPSTPLGRFFDEHMIPYFEDKVSYDDAIAGLRNTLRLYLSE
jgi:multiple sugar transport system substrate-binding protein